MTSFLSSLPFSLLPFIFNPSILSFLHFPYKLDMTH